VAGDERDLIQVALDSTNVVPGEVRWALTLHHAEEAMLRRLSEALAAELAALAKHHGVLLQVQEVDRIAPAAADAFLQARLERALHAVGAPALALPSPVPSDANAMARIAPVGLLLVRARHGIVHHPDERVRQDDALLAVAGLLRAVRGLVGP
jgi:allantoate deiminase